MVESYPEMWLIPLERRSNRTLLKKNSPEGQLVIVVDGIVVGSALSLLVTEDFAFKTRTYKPLLAILTFFDTQSRWRSLYELMSLSIRSIEAYDCRRTMCTKRIV
jgi:hypothetical protein